MRRFWTAANAVAVDGGYTIMLDGELLRLPETGALTIAGRALADAIAGEWATAGSGQKDFSAEDLPLTRLAATARDRVPLYRHDMITELTAYGMNDLLCYRAENEPALADREAQAWQPWLDWAEAKFDVRLEIAAGVRPIAQPQRSARIFAAVLAAMDDALIAGLGVIVPALGSLVLGLAVACGALSPTDACDHAHLDELWQEARWGRDAQAPARRASIENDVGVAARFMILCAA